MLEAYGEGHAGRAVEGLVPLFGLEDFSGSGPDQGGADGLRAGLEELDGAFVAGRRPAPLLDRWFPYPYGLSAERGGAVLLEIEREDAAAGFGDGGEALVRACHDAGLLKFRADGGFIAL